MRNPFPRRNLPPESEPWGREHDNRVDSLSSAVDRLSREVTSLRAQSQGFSRLAPTVPIIRSAHENANGDFTIPSVAHTSIVSGTLTAPAGKTHGIILVSSAIVKAPDNPAVTDSWISSQVVVSAGGVTYTIPGRGYFGYRDPSVFGRSVSILSASRQFEFPENDREYDISFNLRAARGSSNFNNTDPADIASVDIVALFYGEVTPDDTV